MIKTRITNSLIAILFMVFHSGKIYSQCETHACDPVLTGMNWDMACVPENETATLRVGWALSGGDLSCTTPPSSWRIQISFAQGEEYGVVDATAASGPNFSYVYDAANKTINATLSQQTDWAESGEIIVVVTGITTTACTQLTTGANIQIIPAFLGGCPQAFENQIANDALSADLGVDSALPVDLIDFAGAYNSKKDANELTWSTASEINSDYFSLERLNSRGDYEEIAEIRTTGSPAAGAAYSFDDRDILESKTYYYRLVQYDFDGKSEVFPVVAVNVDRGATVSFASYPNPVYDKLMITYTGDISKEDLQVNIFNTMGELVQSVDMTGYTEIEMESLHSGVYFVHVSNRAGKNIFEQKILKL